MNMFREVKYVAAKPADYSGDIFLIEAIFSTYLKTS